ncbi:hypothetical protein FIBSPDRAFT_872372 [Athelia psychrophila]|uniref:Uncharacterized protein n=1 Tax=Athelia psychrophila TaxID=1759441 RepID=A0A165ZKE5_9AGAM|nr:hypothetical protein FIBSPDRAFT_877566 [Fibularhizoctonia sp. CBS 109695]KZP10682.1 hypothetical protein FIBSPDRAFT_872372 [Fibularhizoctonia sp. CBS 109695]
MVSSSYQSQGPNWSQGRDYNDHPSMASPTSGQPSPSFLVTTIHIILDATSSLSRVRCDQLTISCTMPSS